MKNLSLAEDTYWMYQDPEPEEPLECQWTRSALTGSELKLDMGNVDEAEDCARLCLPVPYALQAYTDSSSGSVKCQCLFDSQTAVLSESPTVQRTILATCHSSKTIKQGNLTID